MENRPFSSSYKTLTRKEKAVLRAYFACDCNAEKAAKTLGVSLGTLNRYIVINCRIFNVWRLKALKTWWETESPEAKLADLAALGDSQEEGLKERVARLEAELPEGVFDE